MSAASSTRPGDHDELHEKTRDVWLALSPRRRAACLAWLAFGVTWAITRAITVHGKDSGGGAAISIAGHHVHHYLFGIILLGIVGAISIFTPADRAVEWLGVGYGIGLALIMDEYALLLNLKDVYWTHQGRLSVGLAVGVPAVGSAYITGMAVVHDVARKTRRRFRRT
ncbi:MAG: hypothetical protein ACR2KJ_07870 [Jatrophihabitans sp.]